MKDRENNPNRNSAKSFFNFVFAWAFLFLSACATAPTGRPPSSYLFSTDKSSGVLLGEIKNKLAESSYRVKRLDDAGGVLIADPRKFSFNSPKGRTQATQEIQIHQEGASVTVRLAYLCDYGITGNMGPCDKSDAATNDKISRVEKGLLQKLKPLFLKEDSF